MLFSYCPFFFHFLHTKAKGNVSPTKGMQGVDCESIEKFFYQLRHPLTIYENAQLWHSHEYGSLRSPVK